MMNWFKWFVHNSIVHPIMPFLPKKLAIKLHDKNGEWAFSNKQKAVPDGFAVVPKEPSADVVNHGHQVFLGHFNEGGQTGGRSLYFAYKAMIEAQEPTND